MKRRGKEGEKLKEIKPRSQSLIDRRSDEDRRDLYSIEYFDQGNPERRSYSDRRGNGERRKGYIRVGQWTSVSLKYLETAQVQKPIIL